MTEQSLPELEAERDRLYAQLSMVGDFRRGSVTENYRRCGKPNCACAQPGHRGHGPRFLWTRTARGRGTVGRQLAAASRDGTVTLYDTRDWSEAACYDWGVGKLRSLAFSSGGDLAAAGGDLTGQRRFAVVLLRQLLVERRPGVVGGGLGAEGDEDAVLAHHGPAVLAAAVERQGVAPVGVGDADGGGRRLLPPGGVGHELDRLDPVVFQPHGHGALFALPDFACWQH